MNNNAVTTYDDLQACIEGSNWEILNAKLQRSSAEDAILENEGNQLLLTACQHGAPLEIIMELISIKPEQAQQVDKEFQQTPLHLACLNMMNEDSAHIISLLATQYSQSTTMEDECGMTPLHLMCMNPCKSPASVAAINALCQKGPAALTMENEDGETPIEIFIISQNCNSYEEHDCQVAALDIMHKACGKYLLNAKREAMRMVPCRLARREQQDVLVASRQ